MNLRQLEYFVSVVELGSFSRAALVLDIAQPALSRQVRALETDLRETLLLRNGRGVSLTEAGQRLYEHGVNILQQVAQVREDMGARRDEPAGRITVGLPPTIGRQLTLPLIDYFQRQLPRARLAIVEGLSAHVAEWITSGRVDLGLLYNPEVQPGLEIEPLLEEPLCLVTRGAGAAVATGHGSAAYPVKAATDPGLVRTSDSDDRSAVAVNSARQAPDWSGLPRGPLPLSALAGLPLLMPQRQHVFRRLLETQASLAGVTLDVAWEVSSVAAIIDLVLAGYGHAVLTASAVAASGRADALAARPIAEPGLRSVLCLAASSHRRPGALARHVRQMLKQRVQALTQAQAAQSQPG